MIRWIIRLTVLLIMIGVAAGGFLFWAKSRLDAPGPLLSATNVVIPHGVRSQGIAEQLQEAGVIDQPWLFLLDLRLTGKAGLQAGEYAFPAHVTMGAVIDMMRKGQVVVRKLTFAEGLTVSQMLAELRQAPALTGKVDVPPEEGSLLPQTYHYVYGDSRDQVITRMRRAMDDTLDELWPHRVAGVGLSNKMEALILASVVERETALPEERPHIAAVFLNRLRLHMRLQSDPTVIYAVSQGEGVLPRSLTRDDLAVNSPFNTYVVDGLPAGPICNPGRASLQAVLHPAKSDDLYFVADGSGGHVFAKSLAEHNRNVAKWRSLQKAK